jgi:hypothetical protein
MLILHFTFLLHITGSRLSKRYDQDVDSTSGAMAPWGSELCCQLYDEPATSITTMEDEVRGETGKQRSVLRASQWELVLLKMTGLSEGQIRQEEKE